MARIPLPSQVTPADTGLLYQIINELNNLSDAFGRLGGLSVFKDKTVPTSSLAIVAKTISVISNKSVIGNEEQSFTFEYPEFSGTPVVVATPVVGYSNTQLQNVLVTLSNATSSKATGIVKFVSPGIFTVDINVIAIGPSPTYKA